MATENRVFVAGKVKEVQAEIEVGASNFRKRGIAVTTDEQYPQHILIEFVQDKCDLLNTYKVGDVVEIDFNLKGREWINKEGTAVYFNTLQGWRIKKLSSSSESAPSAAPETDSEEPVEDLPF